MALPKWASAEWFYREGALRETARAFLQEVFKEQVEVEPTKGCWIFLRGSARPGGYKFFGWRGKPIQAHRFAYTLWKGDIPNGLHVLHSCDVPACCNPDHLRVGTDSDNARDRIERARGGGNDWKSRTHCPQGHEYTPENTHVYQGRRYCRACHVIHSTNHARKLARENPERKRQALREWRARKKEQRDGS